MGRHPKAKVRIIDVDGVRTRGRRGVPSSGAASCLPSGLWVKTSGRISEPWVWLEVQANGPAQQTTRLFCGAQQDPQPIPKLGRRYVTDVHRNLCDLNVGNAIAARLTHLSVAFALLLGRDTSTAERLVKRDVVRH